MYIYIYIYIYIVHIYLSSYIYIYIYIIVISNLIWNSLISPCLLSIYLFVSVSHSLSICFCLSFSFYLPLTLCLFLSFCLSLCLCVSLWYIFPFFLQYTLLFQPLHATNNNFELSFPAKWKKNLMNNKICVGFIIRYVIENIPGPGSFGCWERVTLWTVSLSVVLFLGIELSLSRPVKC